MSNAKSGRTQTPRVVPRLGLRSRLHPQFRTHLRRSLALCLSLLLVALAFAPARQAAAAASAAQETPAKARFKLDPHAEYVRGEVLVRFRTGSTVAKQTASARATAKSERASVALSVATEDGGVLPVSVESFDGSDLVPGLRRAHVDVDKTIEAIDALNARADVLYAEPNYIWHQDATPNDPRFFEQSALTRISAQQAWDRTTGSPDVVVGILDSGVDVNHPDLRDNIWTNPGETANDGIDNDNNGFIDDVNGWDFAHNDKTVFDNQTGDDHATHVAGTIGARGNNAIGVTGINWQVKIMSLKVLGPTGGSVADIIDGYNYAKMMKQRGINIRVLNNSYGGAGFAQAARDAILELNSVGILFVAAAGNESSDNFNYANYPSNYDVPNMLAVASTDNADNLSSFSNFGARTVSMGAPGSGILSTTPNNTYGFKSGTSMATPHVAGAAALVCAANPNISPANLRGVLAFSGDPIPSLRFNTTTGRRLNLFNAVVRAQENDTTTPAPVTDLRVTFQNGRGLDLEWRATGDDGTAGQAADYDIFFLNTATGERTLMPTGIVPQSSGTFEHVTVNVPFTSASGNIEVRTYDDSGNSSTASLPVTVAVNTATDPYVVTLSAPGALSTGGTALGLRGDDQYRENYTLPFNFPFYGTTRTSVTISTNGVLYFSTPPKRDADAAPDIAADAGSSVEDLTRLAMIAGLWDDLRTDRTNGDVFVVQPDADRIIFRWQAVTFGDITGGVEEPVNFEIELRRDGTIQMRYGAGQSAPVNTGLLPIVGISPGEPSPYVIASHSSKIAVKNLTNAQTVTFTPRTSIPVTFQFAASNFVVSENVGNAVVTVTRTGELSGTQSVVYRTFSGGETATAGADYTAVSGTLNFASGETSKTFNVPIINDSAVEPTETIYLMLETPSGGATLATPTRAVLYVTDDDVAGANTVQFSGAETTVSESAGHVTLTVTRAGNVANPATVFYQTNNGTANALSDYTAALGTLRFAANETSKTFDIFLTDDVFHENTETFTVTLANASQTSVGAPGTFTVNVTDNDAVTGSNPVKDPTFNAQFFVRQHYVDFFNREPDAPGLAFWTNQITECETRPEAERQTCREVRRINVSAAFFLSIEFQQTGYLVYRAHQAAFNTGEHLSLAAFLADTRQIGRGVIIGQPGAEALLEANKVAYFEDFVSRPAFLSLYPLTMSNAQYVDTLNANTGNSLTPTERDALVIRFDLLQETRATALRKIAENQTFYNRQYNRAFVMMEYIGYLRREPDDIGFGFWFGKLNEFGGNYINAEMVKAFITSPEYQGRFGP